MALVVEKGTVVSWWVYIYLFLIRGYIFNWVGVNEKKKKEKKQGINVSKTECGRGATVEGDGEGGRGSACFGLGLGMGRNCSFIKNVRVFSFRGWPSFFSTQTLTPVQMGAVPGCNRRTCRPGNLASVDEVGVVPVGWGGVPLSIIFALTYDLWC